MTLAVSVISPADIGLTTMAITCAPLAGGQPAKAAVTVPPPCCVICPGLARAET